MVLAPEHELVDSLVPAAWPSGTKDAWTGGHSTPAEAVAAYRAFAAEQVRRGACGRRQGEDRRLRRRFRDQPGQRGADPVFIADYVLAGYGTGAIMAVPGQDERDWEFAEVFDLPIVRTVQPPEDFMGKAFTGRRSGDQLPRRAVLDGLGVTEAKAKIIEWLEAEGRAQGAVTYRLRDWLFSRQRYWGEPFPIVYDETGLPVALPESMLPVELPEVDDFSPKTFDPDDANTSPETPLSRAREWVEVELDLGDGPKRVHPRDQHDAAVGRLVLVRDALRGPDQRRDLRRPGERGVLDGARVRRRLRRRRPVRRRRRARGAAPAVRAVLAQGAVRPGPRLVVRAVPAAVQPGLHPGIRVHRRAVASTCRPRRSSSATAATSTATSRSPASTARWASR